MVKGLIEKNNLIDIANAIREKTGENSVYYPSEMPNKILSIQTGGGGLELTTSLVLTSDVSMTTSSVVLTGVLKADYDTVDTDLHGFLSNATVNLYNDNDVLLDTGITNNEGVVVFNETISEDTTFYCVFDGTSDYESCTSNSVTIEKKENYLIYDDFQASTPDLWTAPRGNVDYTRNDGEMTYTGGDGYDLIHQTSLSGNFRIKFTCTQDTYMTFLLGYGENKSYLFVQPKWALERITPQGQVITVDSHRYNPQTPYEWVIDVVDGNMKMYNGNTLYYDYTPDDPSVLEGQIGFQTVRSRVNKLKNLVVEQL